MYYTKYIINLIKNRNIKFCKNIVRWDLISKFLLFKNQWCNQNLIWILSLGFIDFFKVQFVVACDDVTYFVFFACILRLP
jgi:hypothetical protein